MARESIEKMVSDAFREVGVLIFVFANLDKVISGKVSGWWTLTAIAISALFFSAGLYIERRRPDE